LPNGGFKVTFIFTCKTCNKKYRLSEDEKHVFFEIAKNHGVKKAMDLKCPTCLEQTKQPNSKAAKKEKTNAIQN
jgi:hypothetical protein